MSFENILPINTGNLRRLWIDEISLVKGQGKSIVVLVDLETHKLVGLVSERTLSAIKEVMLKWGEKVLEQIEEVIRANSKNVFISLKASQGNSYKNSWHFITFTLTGVTVENPEKK